MNRSRLKNGYAAYKSKEKFLTLKWAKQICTNQTKKAKANHFKKASEKHD